MRHRPAPTPDLLRAPAGFSLAAGFTGSFLAVTVANVLSLPASAGLLLVAIVVALSSLDATWAATLGVAVLGWLFVTGFLTNQLGELRIASSDDGWRLLLLVAVAMTSAAARRSSVGTRGRVGRIIVAARPAASSKAHATS